MKILKITQKNLIKKVENFLKQGEILIFPTDTVYGLLGDATQEKAVKKVLKIKKRKKGKPFPILIADLDMAKEWAKISSFEEKFLKKVWPGKVTVVLKKKKKLPQALIGKGGTIGLRVPKFSLLNQILKKMKIPLIGTSANLSGFPPSGDPQKILSQFKNQKFQPDFLVDGGMLGRSLPSTVVDLTKKSPQILREGAIKKEKIFALARRCFKKSEKIFSLQAN